MNPAEASSWLHLKANFVSILAESFTNSLHYLLQSLVGWRDENITSRNIGSKQPQFSRPLEGTQTKRMKTKTMKTRSLPMNRRIRILLGLLNTVCGPLMAQDAGTTSSGPSQPMMTSPQINEPGPMVRVDAEKLQTGLRVVLEMADGSRLVGTPVENSLRINAEYVKMEIPLAKVRQCEIRHREERIIVSLDNGDKLTGILEMHEFPLQTTMGKLVPEFAQIDRMTFTTSPPGALTPHENPSACRPPEATGVWTSTQVAAPDSLEGQLRSQGKYWVRTPGEITVGAYVQDILEGRLNQPMGRGAIGKVLSLSTVNGRPTGTVEFGRGYSVPMFLSEVCLVRFIKEGPQPLNIDFGVWKPNPSSQTGPAAAGHAGDFWNAVAVPSNNAHTESGLKFANGDPSTITVEMLNLGGGWHNDGRMGVKAPMLNTFNYPLNNRGGNSRVILAQVPPGKYDLYVYGHKPEPKYYGDYTLTVGDRSYGRKTTFHEDDAGQKAEWVEGWQYVKFTGVTVASGDDIEMLIRPGGEIAAPANPAGLDPNGPVEKMKSAHAQLQLNIEPPPQVHPIWSGGTGYSGGAGPDPHVLHSGFGSMDESVTKPTGADVPCGGTGCRFADAMICGLQLIPAE